MLFSNSKSSLKPSPKHKNFSFGKVQISIIPLAGYLITLPILTLIILYFLLPILPEFISNFFTVTRTSYHPTSIPWIVDASECEHTGRNWRDRKCWDDKHNPLF